MYVCMYKVRYDGWPVYQPLRWRDISHALVDILLLSMNQPQGESRHSTKEILALCLSIGPNLDLGFSTTISSRW